jgi:hypothetical protein
MTISQNDLVSLILELSPIPGLDAAAVASCEELLTGGLIDSMGLLQVVEAIERDLGRPVPAGAISIDNFNSLAAIGRLQAKLAAA